MKKAIKEKLRNNPFFRTMRHFECASSTHIVDVQDSTNIQGLEKRSDISFSNSEKPIVGSDISSFNENESPLFGVKKRDAKADDKEQCDYQSLYQEIIHSREMILDRLDVLSRRLLRLEAYHQNYDDFLHNYPSKNEPN